MIRGSIAYNSKTQNIKWREAKYPEPYQFKEIFENHWPQIESYSQTGNMKKGMHRSFKRKAQHVRSIEHSN